MTLQPPPLPTCIRVPALGLAIVLTLSAPVFGVLAAVLPAKPGWAMIGFEVVVLVSGVLGILLGLGRFRDGPALGLACVGGTCIVASGLAAIGVQRHLGTMSLDTYLGGRVLVGGAFILLGALAVLGRTPRSRQYLGRCAVVCIPLVLVVAVLAFTPARAVLRPTTGMLEAIRILGLLLGGFVIVAIVSIAGHLGIRAFDVARDADGHD
ncbi:MAG: hypothetical protein KDA28_16655 [Phycisphaerales bacterium]|nr:hypothetical protein [Phycisphaerales bacterium]